MPTARDKIQSAQECLRQRLCREPLLTEVAREIGVSRERVRQLYVELGLDTTAGIRQKHGPGRKKRAERSRRYATRLKASDERRQEIVRYAREHQGATQAEIAKVFNVSQGVVSYACRAAGINRCYRFDSEEDQVIEDVANTEAARLLNRSAGVVAQRRMALRHGVERQAFTDDEQDAIVATFDRLQSWAKTAREHDISAAAVKNVVRKAKKCWRLRDCIRGAKT